MTFVNVSSGLTAEPKWGTLQGQVILEGVVPKLPLLVPVVPGLVNQDVPDEMLVVNHPYAAVTGKDGRFEIRDSKPARRQV
jgi:hypothetical protein